MTSVEHLFVRISKPRHVYLALLAIVDTYFSHILNLMNYGNRIIMTCCDYNLPNVVWSNNSSSHTYTGVVTFDS